jgi:hypothetical protein
VLLVLALIGVLVISKNDESDASKHRGKIVTSETVKASTADKEEAQAASSAKNDACGKCTVEKVPDEQLTAEKSGNEWKFFGHKCVGSSACDDCEVDNCTGVYDDRPPTGPCNHCSPKAKK